MCCGAKKFKESYNFCLRISTAAYKLLEDNVPCHVPTLMVTIIVSAVSSHVVCSGLILNFIMILIQLWFVAREDWDLDPGSRRVSTQNYSRC